MKRETVVDGGVTCASGADRQDLVPGTRSVIWTLKR